MKRDAVKKVKACSGPCGTCANNIVVFGPSGTMCKFGPAGPLGDRYLKGATRSTTQYEAKREDRK